MREVGGEVASHRAAARLRSRTRKRCSKAALKAYGRVDQLVVASGTNKPGFIQDLAYEDWQAVMDANVRGIWLMAKAVGSYWIENKASRQGAADVVGARPPRQFLRLYRLLHARRARPTR